MKRVNGADIEYFKGVVEPGRVSTGESVLDLHSRDQSHHRPCRPDVVIWPISAHEVSKILIYCNEKRIPVTPWGVGTSLEGNPIPVKGGVVLDFSHMNRILEIRADDFQVDVEPGVNYKDLNEKLRHLGLFFPPDPGANASIGGMIGNNASGTRTVKYGSTRDYVLRLKVVLASGEVVEVGSRASKSSSGYDLLHLFVGSEGTLGVVVEATLRLVGSPPEYSAMIVVFDDLDSAGRAVFEIMRAGLDPAALEVLSLECVDLINKEKALGLPFGPTMFVEFVGPSQAYLEDVIAMAQEICKEAGAIDFETGIGRERRDQLFKARHELGEMIIRANPNRGMLTTDVAVPISRFPYLLSFAKKVTSHIGIPAYIFGHAGNGNIHIVFMGDNKKEGEWDTIHRINEMVVDKALEMGGTCTGEHGIGIGKVNFMKKEHPTSLGLMRKIKGLLDPNGILNPGKVLPEE